MAFCRDKTLTMMTHFWIFLFAYLLGSISSAIIVCRLMGLPDPREQGSGNPGATNVMRLGGKKAAAITLFGDILKGLLPVLLAQLISTDLSVAASAGLGAFLGHLYPVFFAFRGGKGVATAFGALLGLTPLAALAALLTWLLIARVFRLSSLAALIAALLTPVYMWLLHAETMVLAIAAAMIFFLIWRHRSNIQRLLRGSESRI